MLIPYLTFVLFVTLVTVSAKCDVMNEFKPDIDDIMNWAKDRCEANPEVTDDDLSKCKSCYGQHIQPLLTSEHGKAVNTFLIKHIFGNSDCKKACTDRNVLDKIKKTAMKEVGMKNGLACKKDVEAECAKYKTGLQNFNFCMKEEQQ